MQLLGPVLALESTQILLIVEPVFPLLFWLKLAQYIDNIVNVDWAGVAKMRFPCTAWGPVARPDFLPIS